MDYSTFIANKIRLAPPCGLTNIPDTLPDLMPHQTDLTRWALRRGRAAIFAATGLGKTRMQLRWAETISRSFPGKPILILAPLAVAAQTVAEGARIGVSAKICRDGADVIGGINITNYDRMHRFGAVGFVAIICDESSIIKHHDAKTFRSLCEMFAATPYKLCATATPAPNDFTELGTHAQFLGVCTQAEMLAEYFVHDGGDTQTWRLKRHARAAFWRWVASWGALVQMPSDLGHADDGYVLPALKIERHIVRADTETYRNQGLLFALEAQSLSERRAARKASTDERVRACAEVIAREPQEQWLVWCDLNRESKALVDAIPGAIEVEGSQDVDTKEQRLSAFAQGSARVLVSKPSICGHGLNLQRCARMAFVGVTDSWEAYFQAVRRCWRFGQTRPVEVHIFASEAEGSVIENLARKERQAAEMAGQLSAETRGAVRSAVQGAIRTQIDYKPTINMEVPKWLAI